MFNLLKYRYHNIFLHWDYIGETSTLLMMIMLSKLLAFFLLECLCHAESNASSSGLAFRAGFRVLMALGGSLL